MNTQELFAQAIEQAATIIEKTIAGMGMEPPGREELRARFEALMAAPDDAAYEQLRSLGERHFGPDWVDREAMLAQRRREMAGG